MDLSDSFYDLLQNTSTVILILSSRVPCAHTHQVIVKNTLVDAAVASAWAPVHIVNKIC